MSTGISWTDETWNPLAGCTPVSEGCRNCYAAKTALRLEAMGQEKYRGTAKRLENDGRAVFTGTINLDEGTLEKPLRWKKPRRVFVNSMSDLFHERVPDEFIDAVFAVMALCPQHTFQVLTKRPERMGDYLTETWQPDLFRRAAGIKEWETRRDRVLDRAMDFTDPNDQRFWNEADGLAARDRPWPLPNVWLGTSVEDQRAADTRIPHLLRTPAAVRFLSCEPLIGPVKLDDYVMLTHNNEWGSEASEERGWGYDGYSGGFVGPAATDSVYDPQPGIHWVIAGGESGPNFRPMDEQWARDLRDQCVAASVPYFFKQHSGPRNEMGPELDGELWHQFPGEAEVEARA